MTSFDRAALQEAASSLGIPMSTAILNQLDAYAALILEWNEQINLTAITDATGIAVKHFADSLSLVRFVTPRPGSSLVDVGSGAGLPGIVLKIFWPQVRLTVVESVGKKAGFIAIAAKRLNLGGVTVHADRAEAVAFVEKERHDIAVARGVSSLEQVAEWTLPLLKRGGLLFAYKAEKGKDEVDQAAGTIKRLGGNDTKVLPVHIPTLDDRLLIRVRKTYVRDQQSPE